MTVWISRDNTVLGPPANPDPASPAAPPEPPPRSVVRRAASARVGSFAGLLIQAAGILITTYARAGLCDPTPSRGCWGLGIAPSRQVMKQANISGRLACYWHPGVGAAGPAGRLRQKETPENGRGRGGGFRTGCLGIVIVGRSEDKGSAASVAGQRQPPGRGVVSINIMHAMVMYSREVSRRDQGQTPGSSSPPTMASLPIPPGKAVTAI